MGGETLVESSTCSVETLSLGDRLALGDTLALGEKLGRAAHAGDFFSLLGELGAGKSRLAEGIARGLGVDPSLPIASPTFTIVNEYEARHLLVHADFYRLESERELENLGWRDYEARDPVTVVEWLSKVGEAHAPADRLDVELVIRSETERSITLRAHGPRGRRLLAACRGEG